MNDHGLIARLIQLIGGMVLCIACFSAAVAGTTALGDFGFTIPTGWTILRASDTQLALSNQQSGSVNALAPQTLASTPGQAVKQLLATIPATDSAARWRSFAAITKSGAPVQYASGFIEIRRRKAFVIVVIILDQTAKPSRFASLSLIDTGFRGKQALQAEFAEILASARFDAIEVDQLTKPAPGETMVGYFRAETSANATTANPRINAISLLPNGRFAFNIPASDDPMDTHCQRHPTDCGRYRIKGDTLHTWRTATTLERTLGLQRTEHRSFSVRPNGDIEIDRRLLKKQQ